MSLLGLNVKYIALSTLWFEFNNIRFSDRTRITSYWFSLTNLKQIIPDVKTPGFQTDTNLLILCLYHPHNAVSHNMTSSLSFSRTVL